MTVKQQWMVVLGIVATLAGGAFAASHFLKDELTSISVGSDAPGFAAVVAERLHLRGRVERCRGEVVVLNIWATWCIPCRTEMPSMEKLYRELGPKGLKMVAVSVDNAGEETTIRNFVKEYGLTFEILHDAAGSIQSIYRTTGVPETFVLDRDGVIRKKWIGADDWASEGNKRLLEQLLAQPKS